MELLQHQVKKSTSSLEISCFLWGQDNFSKLKLKHTQESAEVENQVPLQRIPIDFECQMVILL